jgi:hypothetical protein
MSDGVLDSIVSALRENQLQSESSRVVRAQKAAEQAISASRASRASRERSEITPVPDDILRTHQTLPKTALERRRSKKISLYRTRHATSTSLSSLSVPCAELRGCCSPVPLDHITILSITLGQQSVEHRHGQDHDGHNKRRILRGDGLCAGNVEKLTTSTFRKLGT